MTRLTRSRWLLVALAIAVLAVAVPVVGAHGPETTADDAPPYDDTATGWGAWMTDHVGPGGAEWMETPAGVTVDEMPETTADAGRALGTTRQGHC